MKPLKIEHTDGTAYCQRCDTDLPFLAAPCKCNGALEKQDKQAKKVMTDAREIIRGVIAELKRRRDESK